MSERCMGDACPTCNEARLDALRNRIGEVERERDELRERISYPAPVSDVLRFLDRAAKHAAESGTDLADDYNAYAAAVRNLAVNNGILEAKRADIASRSRRLLARARADRGGFRNGQAQVQGAFDEVWACNQKHVGERDTARAEAERPMELLRVGLELIQEARQRAPLNAPWGMGACAWASQVSAILGGSVTMRSQYTWTDEEADRWMRLTAPEWRRLVEDAGRLATISERADRAEDERDRYREALRLALSARVTPLTHEDAQKLTRARAALEDPSRG